MGSVDSVLQMTTEYYDDFQLKVYSGNDLTCSVNTVSYEVRG
jgi:hypothetical protein